MNTWEYDIVRLSGTKDIDMIPVLEVKGAQGWELVSVVASPVPVDKKTQYLAFFKRRLEIESNN